MFLFTKIQSEKNLYRESLLLLPKQITATLHHGQWHYVNKLNRPIKQIVINGMGGSNLGAEIVREIFKKNLTCPIIIEPGYNVPAFVNKDTAYIVSSYSGTTEEPLTAYVKAKKKGALVIALTSLGDNKLLALAKKYHDPILQFPTEANPSDQPRLGLGASLTSLIMILIELKLLSPKIKKDLVLASKKLTLNNKLFLNNKNEALKIARQLKKHQPILVGGPSLAGNLKTLRNQLCETSKNLAQYLIVSDMNHFALEGLSHPKINRKNLIGLFFTSNLDDKKITQRLTLTREVFKRNKLKVIECNLLAKTLLEQNLTLLQLGSFITYYLANLNQVNPMIVPWVDWFKKNLKK
jgi:glucose/mannose-6-phosphate isomerase